MPHTSGKNISSLIGSNNIIKVTYHKRSTAYANSCQELASPQQSKHSWNILDKFLAFSKAF